MAERVKRPGTAPEALDDAALEGVFGGVGQPGDGDATVTEDGWTMPPLGSFAQPDGGDDTSTEAVPNRRHQS